MDYQTPIAKPQENINEKVRNLVGEKGCVTLKDVLATAGNVESFHVVSFRKKVQKQKEINSTQQTFMCHALCYALNTWRW